VKIAGVFISDNQAVHELIWKIVDSNPPNRPVNVRCPGMERIDQSVIFSVRKASYSSMLFNLGFAMSISQAIIVQLLE
jgi:hypothetical protein